MAECKYLYGASIQGIQSFIFQTDKLKDIVGASSLVEQACTELFEDYLKESDELLVSAAGKVKCIFSDIGRCRNAVLTFPKKVMEKAPGVTISQAVVTIGDSNYSSADDELERRLRSQRNRPRKLLSLGLMAMERSRKTGLPAIYVKDTAEPIDEGSYKKSKEVDTSSNSKLYRNLYDRQVDYKKNLDISSLTECNDWVAIIHADGNGLGEVVAEIGSDRGKLREFSKKLDDATICASRNACLQCSADSEDLPIRPIVIGGDDLTVICRASIAVDFARNYLCSFEKESIKTGHSLSACAGISFIKSSYPFHYGYKLAETLCEIAKKDAKSDEIKKANNGRVPSCIMFHKVQSSFVEDFDTIARKELTAADNSSFCFGPYYLSDKPERWTIDKLIGYVEELSIYSNNKIKTSVREWLTLMGENRNKASQKEKRVRSLSIYSDKQKKLFHELTSPMRGGSFYPAYDVMALLTVMNQVTK